MAFPRIADSTNLEGLKDDLFLSEGFRRFFSELDTSRILENQGGFLWDSFFSHPCLICMEKENQNQIDPFHHFMLIKTYQQEFDWLNPWNKKA